MKKILLQSTFVVYLLIGLEIFIMISPFAGYFYSFYTPFLNYLYNSTYTNWLTEFFLPHFVFLKDPLMQAIGLIQLITFFFGMGLFFYAAIPLYYTKFRRKGVVTGGIYNIIRHPQYLGLAIAGFGLLLYWPRFIILLLYVSMVFVYYLFAKNEEQRMIKQYGKLYKDYMERVPMFLPGNIGGRLYSLFFGTRDSKTFGIIILYCITMTVSIALAFALRNISIKRIPVTQTNGLAIISVLPEKDTELQQIINLIKIDDRIKIMLKERVSNLIYIMPSDFFLMAIVTDMERLYPVEFEKPSARNTLIRFIKIFINYTKMQMGIYDEIHSLRRIIFFSVKDLAGNSLQGKEIFSLGSRRFPLFLVDMDMEKGEVISVKELKPRHKWGETPMPLF